jgi:hypothetical protein
MSFNSSVFAVDKLDLLAEQTGKPIAWVGTQGENTVLQFPIDTPYILVERTAVRTLSPHEAAREQYLEERNMKKLYDKILGKEKEVPAADARPGQYV